MLGVIQRLIRQRIISMLIWTLIKILMLHGHGQYRRTDCTMVVDSLPQRLLRIISGPGLFPCVPNLYHNTWFSLYRSPFPADPSFLMYTHAPLRYCVPSPSAIGRPVSQDRYIPLVRTPSMHQTKPFRDLPACHIRTPHSLSFSTTLFAIVLFSVFQGLHIHAQPGYSMNLILLPPF